jgi:hypothetical protein
VALGFNKERGNLSSRCEGRSASAEQHKRQSTDAGHGGGTTRSRVEGAVMVLDRRGGVVWFYCAGNLQGEDWRG